MEAGSRGRAEQLRDLEEKDFQLLERLKLAEGGKSKATEALKRKGPGRCWPSEGECEVDQGKH
jgi:hypothetical protein